MAIKRIDGLVFNDSIPKDELVADIVKNLNSREKADPGNTYISHTIHMYKTGTDAGRSYYVVSDNIKNANGLESNVVESEINEEDVNKLIDRKLVDMESIEGKIDSAISSTLSTKVDEEVKKSINQEKLAQDIKTAIMEELQNNETETSLSQYFLYGN